MGVVVTTVVLLMLSNIFMTFAWYAHLRNLNDRPWYLAAMLSWGIAFFEYMLQVPANRIGNTVMDLSKLKILQEVITLDRVRAVSAALHAPAVQGRLPVGGALHDGRGVFRVPELT